MAKHILEYPAGMQTCALFRADAQPWTMAALERFTAIMRPGTSVELRLVRKRTDPKSVRLNERLVAVWRKFVAVFPFLKLTVQIDTWSTFYFSVFLTRLGKLLWSLKLWEIQAWTLDTLTLRRSWLVTSDSTELRPCTDLEKTLSPTAMKTDESVHNENVSRNARMDTATATSFLNQSP
jgi:hypothetical protein